MNPLQTLLRWLAPLLNPLEAFRTHVSHLASIHQDSVHTFDLLASGLMAAPTGSSEAFTGELATSFWQDVQAYLQAENALMNTSTGTALAGEGGVDAAIAACQDCVAEITSDTTTAAAQVSDDAAIDEATGMVDAAAVAEAGANPFADVAGIILTLVAGAALLATLYNMGWNIYEDVQRWQRAMYHIGDTPLPQLPPNPTPVTAPEPKTSSTSPTNVHLTPQQQREVQDLLRAYPGADQDDIENLVKLGYDKASIEVLLRAGFTHSQLAIVIARTQAALTKGTDQYGLTVDKLRQLFVSVADALNSGDQNRILEGQVALLMLANLIGFQKPVVDPSTGAEITDIDVETPDAIIEVTNKKEGKLGQITKQQTNPYVNPTGKPVIFFAPRYKPTGAKNMQKQGIPYAKSLDELRQLLKKMFGGP